MIGRQKTAWRSIENVNGDSLKNPRCTEYSLQCYLCAVFSCRDGEQLVIFGLFPCCIVLCSKFLEGGCVSSTTTRVIWRYVLTPGLHPLLPFVTVKRTYSAQGWGKLNRLLQSIMLMSVSACEAFQQWQLWGDFLTYAPASTRPSNTEKSAAWGTDSYAEPLSQYSCKCTVTVVVVQIQTKQCFRFLLLSHWKTESENTLIGSLFFLHFSTCSACVLQHSSCWGRHEFL